MIYFRFADNNEAELAGSREGWTKLMHAISSGEHSIGLDLEIAPYAFDRIGTMLRIVLVDGIEVILPVGRFFVDDESLVFTGTHDDLEWLVNQIDALLKCNPGTHFHIDSISFAERLVEETLDLVFHLDGEGWPTRGGKALQAAGGKIRNPGTGDHIFPGEWQGGPAR